MMNICVISPGYPTKKTIDFIFVDQVCRFFALKGASVTIIAPQSISKSILRFIPFVPRRSIIEIPNAKDIILHRPYYITFGGASIIKSFNLWSFNRSVKRAASKLDIIPDVCYGHFWHTVYAIFPFAKKYGIPLIASSGEEVISLHKNYSPTELKDFVDYVKGVISVSTKNKNEIIDAGLSIQDKCVVIPNAIDPNLFYRKNKLELRKRFGFNVDDFIVAYVGQFTERKGIKRLSRALSTLNDISIKAMFMGSGIESPDYKETIFKGTVPHHILPDYLNCADIFVLPTTNEGCSNAIIEAMACGLPIISSDLPFNHDILNENNALLIDPFDVNEIARSIKLLRDSSEIREKMIENVITTSSLLTLDIRAEKILNYINKLITK